MRQANASLDGSRPVRDRLIVAGVLFLLSACGQSAADRLATATQLVEEKDYPTAVVELKNALQDNPDSLEARLMLARVSLAMGDPLSAEKELDRAYDLGAEAAAHRATHYRIQLALGRFEQVVVSLQQEGGADGLSTLERSEIEGDAHLGLGDFLAAEKIFRSALDLDSSSATAQVGLAQALAGQGRVEEASTAVDELTRQQPDFAAGWLLKGRLALRDGRMADARDAFVKAAEAARKEPDRIREFLALSGQAEAELAMGDIDAAEVSVGRLNNLAGNSPAARLLAARLAFAQGDYAAARADLQRVLNAMPNNLGAQLLLGTVYLAEGDLPQAERTLSMVVEAAPDNLAARQFLAQAQLGQSRPESAVEALTPLLEEGNTDARTSLLAGQALLRTGQQDEGIRLLEETYKAEPGNLQIAMSLGASYLATGRIDDAINLVESIPETQGDYRRDLLLAVAYSARDESAEADRKIESILAEHGNDVGALKLVSSFYFSRGDIDAARDYVTRALEFDAEDVEAHLALARMEYRAGNVDAGTRQLERVLELDADNKPALLTLADQAARGGQLDDSAAFLQRVVDADPKAAMPRMMLARVYVRQGKPALAEQSAREGYNRDPDDLPTTAVMGEILMAVGKFREALGFFSQVVERQPESPVAWYNRARAQVALDERTDARRSLRRALELQPDWLQASVLLALLEMRDEQPEQALEIAKMLQDKYADQAAAHVLEADIMLNMERYAEAAAAYDRAYEIQPTAIVALRSYQSRTRAGGDGKSMLEDWLQTHPDDSRVRLALAEHYQARGETARAIAEYERVLEVTTENAPALNNLAWMLNERGDTRALNYARQAYALVPDSPAIADTLGWVLVSNGKLDEGLKVLTQAAEAAPDDGDIHYHLAVALHEKGQTDRARRLLKATLAMEGNFPSRQPATDLLNEIGVN